MRYIQSPSDAFAYGDGQAAMMVEFRRGSHRCVMVCHAGIIAGRDVAVRIRMTSITTRKTVEMIDDRKNTQNELQYSTGIK